MGDDSDEAVWQRVVDGPLLPWLLVTAHNTHRNTARAVRRHRAFLAALPPHEHVPDPADVVAERDDPRIAALRATLADARPADARLLVMTALEGFSIREAAAVLGPRCAARGASGRGTRPRVTGRCAS